MAEEKNENTAHQEEVKKLEQKFKALSEEKKELEVMNEELKKNNDSFKSDLDSALDTIEELSERISLLENSEDGNVIVKVGKKSYQLIGKKFHTSKGLISASELSKDPELLKKLVDLGSGLLVEVEVSN